MPAMIDPVLFERLKRRIEYDTIRGCWLWTGARFESGYGNITYRGRHIRTHRAMWEAVHGHPGTQLILHECDTPPCCNPDHLRVGSHQDNADDKRKRDRYRPADMTGSKNPRARLSENIVSSILLRLNQGEREADLAREFGVAPCTINNIFHRRKWRHVTHARND